MSGWQGIGAVISLAFCLMLLPANAEQERGLSAAELLQLYKSDPQSKEHVARVVQATGQGLALANAALERRRQAPLYCAPNNLALTGEQIVDIIGRFVETIPALAKTQWEAVMLGALQNLFPCR